MSNGANNFYDRLSRLWRIVKRNQGIELSLFYQKGRRVVTETRIWDLPAYAFKLESDGQCYFQDVHKGGVFTHREIYTTDYVKGGSE